MTAWFFDCDPKRDIDTRVHETLADSASICCVAPSVPAPHAACAAGVPGLSTLQEKDHRRLLDAAKGIGTEVELVFFGDTQWASERYAELLNARISLAGDRPLLLHLIPFAGLVPPANRVEPRFPLQGYNRQEFTRTWFRDDAYPPPGPIFLQAPPGSGKTLAAHELRKYLGLRGPLIEMDCRAFSEAERTRRWRGSDDAPAIFVTAADGVLLLHGIEALSEAEQISLSSMLSAHSSNVHGVTLADHPWRASCQVVFTSHHRVEQLLAEGRWSPELHFRVAHSAHHRSLYGLLNTTGSRPEEFLRHWLLMFQEQQFDVYRLAHAKSLRSRAPPNIWQAFLDAFSLVRHDRALVRRQNSPAAERMKIPKTLVQYRWPGNFSELENLAHRCLMADLAIGSWSWCIETTFQKLRVPGEAGSAGRSPNTPRPELACKQLLGQAWYAALTRRNRCLSQVADDLGLDGRTLRSRLRRWLAQPDPPIGDVRRDLRHINELVAGLQPDEQTRFRASVAFLVRDDP